MANITAYYPLDMSGTDVDAGGDAYIDGSTHLFVVEGNETVHYYGTGFLINVFGDLLAGTLNSIVGTLSGVTQYEVTGLNHSIVTFNNYLLANDVQGAYAFLFSGNDSLSGSSGDDYFIGYAGTDTLIGGQGNDTYHYDGVDLLVEGVDAGMDTIVVGFSYELPANFEGLTLSGSASLNGIGNAHNNFLSGNSAQNRLEGLGGVDTIHGGDGADTLDGGIDRDWLTGGNGDDVYFVDNELDLIFENSGGGFDVIYSTVSRDILNLQVESVVLVGMGNVDVTGNGLNNFLVGNAGANRLWSEGGVDTVDGGLGNDTIYDAYHDFSGDSLYGGGGDDWIWGVADDTLNGGPGADTLRGNGSFYVIDEVGDYVDGSDDYSVSTVVTSISYTLPQNIENLHLAGGAALSGTGNSLYNVIVGNGESNYIDGAGGVDSLIGGGGDDTYVIDSLLHPHILTFSGAPGDYVTQGRSYEYTGTTGLFYAPSVMDASGDGFVDALSFRYADQLRNDWFLDVAASFAGLNLEPGVYLNTRAYSQSFVNLRLYGNGRSGYDSGKFVIDEMAVDYSGANPRLLIFSAAFEFYSSTGDVIASGQIYYDIVNSTTEPVIENVDGGIDTLRSSIDASLAANLENLVLTGSGDLDGSGNSANNLISGNAGNNILDGAGGADIIAGGPGNDTYVVDNSGDQVMELGSSGIDAVQSGVSYDLMQAWHVENLTLTGGSAVNGSGNWLDNLITGNDAANRLEGNRGNDMLDGGGGADTLVGGLGADGFYFDAHGVPDADQVLDFQGGVDCLWLSQSVFAAFSATGAVSAQNMQFALENQLAATSGNGGDGGQDYLKYATDTGRLYYDADGTGAGGLSLIATVYSAGTTPAALSPESDIVIT